MGSFTRSSLCEDREGSRGCVEGCWVLFFAPCSRSGVAHSAPVFPSPLCDASCPGAVAAGSQLCLVCSAANKCSWFCSRLLIYALERHRATGSLSVLSSLLGGLCLSGPGLPCLLPSPVLAACRETGLVPPRASLALCSRQGWQSPACPQLCQSWTPVLPTLCQVQVPLHPDGAGGDRHV